MDCLQLNFFCQAYESLIIFYDVNHFILIDVFLPLDSYDNATYSVVLYIQDSSDSDSSYKNRWN